jgi:hypothetical protein
VFDGDNRDFLYILSHNFGADISKNVTESTSMMFKQVLDVDKVITQLLACSKKTDKQVNIYIIKFISNFDVLAIEKRKRRERERNRDSLVHQFQAWKSFWS